MNVVAWGVGGGTLRHRFESSRGLSVQMDLANALCWWRRCVHGIVTLQGGWANAVRLICASVWEYMAAPNQCTPCVSERQSSACLGKRLVSAHLRRKPRLGPNTCNGPVRDESKIVAAHMATQGRS